MRSLLILSLLTIFTITSSKVVLVSRHDIDEGKIIEAEVGDRLHFSFLSNATTGFLWEVDENINASHYSLANKNYIPQTNPYGLSGLGGVQNFYFDLKEPKAFKIVFHHRRGKEELLSVIAKIHVSEKKDKEEKHEKETLAYLN